MEKNQTVHRLLTQYVGATSQKVVALMFGDGINAIPDKIGGAKLRYAKLSKGRPTDLSDLADADCAIVDMHCLEEQSKDELKRFLQSIKDDKDYLVITEATNHLGSDLVALLETFRPRLIVTSNRLGNCA